MGPKSSALSTNAALRWHAEVSFLTLPISLVSTSPLSYSFSVGWPYSACYCSTSDVLVRWLHQDPTNSIPAFLAFQCHPAMAQSLDIFPPHPDSQQFLTVSYWNQQPICILLLSSQQGFLISLISFQEYTLRKPQGLAHRHNRGGNKEQTNIRTQHTANCPGKPKLLQHEHSYLPVLSRLPSREEELHKSLTILLLRALALAAITLYI